MILLVEKVVENSEKWEELWKPSGRRVFQRVTHHADGADFHTGAEVVQLLPEEGNIDLHMVVLRLGVVPPELQQQGFLGEDLVPVAEQQLRQIKLLPAQTDGAVPADQREGAPVQRQIAEFQKVTFLQVRPPAVQRILMGL